MKKILSIMLTFYCTIAIANLYSQETVEDIISDDPPEEIISDENTDENTSTEEQATENNETTTDSTKTSKTQKSDNKKFFDFGLSAVFGATSINGENYQQIGLRPSIRLGKFGLGLDTYILIDKDGTIRAEDWDGTEDYSDRIYYISWAEKGAPFYFRFGGLEDAYLGYRISVNGYSNLVEYPSYKRQGLDLGFEVGKFGTELFLNDFKELFRKKSSFVGGGRIYYKIIGNLSAGIGIAGDLNEYKGLRDQDGDGYPDEVDKYPLDSSFVTDRDKYRALGVTEAAISNLTSAGLLDATERANITSTSGLESTVSIYSGDIGYDFIKSETMDFTVYTQFAQVYQTKGYGFSLPGARFRFLWLTLTGEYRQTSDKFQFGYFNQTYELERARYKNDGNGNLVIQTKRDVLENEKAKKGYMAGLEFNIANIFVLKGSFQDIIAKNKSHDRSLTADFGVAENLIPKISELSAYYIQNNVENISQFKTPSTITGAKFKYELAKGAAIQINYQLTFEDKNGDGKINGSEETIKNIYISAASEL